MKSEKEIKNDLLKRIREKPEDFLLFVDFDGTLANMNPLRDEAYILEKSRHALVSMQDVVMIVTGRDCQSLDNLVNHQFNEADNIYFSAITEHGCVCRIAKEISSSLSKDELNFIKAQKRSAKEFVERLFLQYQLGDIKFQAKKTSVNNSEAKSMLVTLTPEHLLETCKQSALAFHTRPLYDAMENKPSAETLAQIASDFQAYLEDALENSEVANAFSLLPGHKVIELKPKKSDKGLAMTKILDRSLKKKQILMFAGDDFAGTDGPAAEVIKRRGGLIIQVLNPDKPERHQDIVNANRNPDLVFDSPADLANFLQEIADVYLNAKTTWLNESNSASEKLAFSLNQF